MADGRRAGAGRLRRQRATAARVGPAAAVRLARASRLLGAETVLTGISPEVARTLVQLGVDLRDYVTRGDLRRGIAHALSSRGGAAEATELRRS